MYQKDWKGISGCYARNDILVYWESMNNMLAVCITGLFRTFAD